MLRALGCVPAAVREDTVGWPRSRACTNRGAPLARARRRRAYHALSWGGDADELRRGLELAKKVQQALINGGWGGLGWAGGSMGRALQL